MPIFTASSVDEIPLSLYVHIPWCVQKCPYCDFNSHALKDIMPQKRYVEALMQELDSHLPAVAGRPLVSIFFGGGTPSLFSAASIGQILTGIDKRLPLPATIEITLEANPGTIDEANFQGFYAAGVNRLSLGIQSLQDDKLKQLGRIHDSKSALSAIETAKRVGFRHFNLDLMYGLPEQSITDALHDLEKALATSPTHLSWYQLTIEPNTFFHHQPPPLPPDDLLWDMQLAGQSFLQDASYLQYEVSAYAKNNQSCKHNCNYWEFGDYLGIGAGAHSKLTAQETGQIIRFSQVKHPRDYLIDEKRRPQQLQQLSEQDRVFEFMLNALRLTNGVPFKLFEKRTGLSLAIIAPLIKQAQARGWLINDQAHLCPTESGKRFLNDLVSLFLS